MLIKIISEQGRKRGGGNRDFTQQFAYVQKCYLWWIGITLAWPMINSCICLQVYRDLPQEQLKIIRWLIIRGVNAWLKRDSTFIIVYTNRQILTLTLTFFDCSGWFTFRGSPTFLTKYANASWWIRLLIQIENPLVVGDSSSKADRWETVILIADFSIVRKTMENLLMETKNLLW